jgi:hypothetical protein
MKGIIPYCEKANKSKNNFGIANFIKLLKIYGTQIPQKLPSFSAHKQ